MESEWLVKRATLRWLQKAHPQWTLREKASYLHMSVGWVKKWQKRLREAPADDLSVLHSRSRARRTPFPRPDPLVVERLVLWRESPPENLKRIPGSPTLLYYATPRSRTCPTWHPFASFPPHDLEDPASRGLDPAPS